MDRLKKILKRMGRVVIAFSGGVDSTFLVKIAKDVLGRDNVLAVTAASETFPRSELRDAKKFAKVGVEVIISDSADMKAVRDNSADIVFMSDFLEHLTKESIIDTLKETWRILRPKGKLLIIQPNIRYCMRDYWMFFDHVTPLDDRSMGEVLVASGFEVTECRARFLPYTTKSYLRNFAFLLKVYLKVPLLHRLFGQQSFIVAEKRG